MAQSVPAAYVGSPYYCPLTAWGGAPPYTWSSPDLPAGLSLRGSGNNWFLTGTPTTPAIADITFTVTDGTQTASTLLSLAVKATPSVATVTTAALPVPSRLQPYSTTLHAAGGTPPYTWTVTGLPQGLTVDTATGIISGTPGEWSPRGGSITARVTDSASVKSAPVTLVMPVSRGLVNLTANSNAPFYSGFIMVSGGLIAGGYVGEPYQIWLPIGVQNGNANQFGTKYHEQLIIAGQPPYSWQVLQKPEWMTLDGANLYGTPTAPGNNTLILQATDSLGVTSGPVTFTLPVYARASMTDYVGRWQANQSGGTAGQPNGTNFDYFVAPDGDDANDGSFNNPWSITACGAYNPTTPWLPPTVARKIPVNCRVGFKPGRYRRGKVGGRFVGVPTSGPLLVAGGTLAPMPKAATPIVLGSCDESGHYAPRRASIEASNPDLDVNFIGYFGVDTTLKPDGLPTLTITSITSAAGGMMTPFINLPGWCVGAPAGGYPVYIDFQISGTAGGVGTYAVSVESQPKNIPATVAPGVPLTAVRVATSPGWMLQVDGGMTWGAGNLCDTGYVTFAGFHLKYFGQAGIGARYCSHIEVFDCEFGPARVSVRGGNPGAVLFQWTNACHVYNNKFHDLSTPPPTRFYLAAAPAPPSWSSGSLVQYDRTTPAPYPYFVVSGAPVNWGFRGGPNRPGGTLKLRQGNAAISTDAVKVSATLPDEIIIGPTDLAPYGLPAIMQIPGGFVSSNVYHHNTIFRAIDMPLKDYTGNCCDYHHNYYEAGIWALAFGWTLNGVSMTTTNPISRTSSAHFWIQGNAMGQVTNVHHNIIINGVNLAQNMAAGMASMGMIKLWNNTFLEGNWILQSMFPNQGVPSPPPFAQWTFQSNLCYRVRHKTGVNVYMINQWSAYSIADVPPSANLDYNCFPSSATFTWGLGLAATQGSNLTKTTDSTGRGRWFPGYEKNSHSLSASPYPAGMPLGADPSNTIHVASFAPAATVGGSANPAISGGMGGVTCGAVDVNGKPTDRDPRGIGCDW